MKKIIAFFALLFIAQISMAQSPFKSKFDLNVVDFFEISSQNFDKETTYSDLENFSELTSLQQKYTYVQNGESICNVMKQFYDLAEADTGENEEFLTNLKLVRIKHSKKFRKVVEEFIASKEFTSHPNYVDGIGEEYLRKIDEWNKEEGLK